MISLGPIALAAPWALLALAALPLLWWLLAATPPAPRHVPFPPLRLLANLPAREETPARTPPWLIALRLLIAALLILAAAHPFWGERERLGGSGPLLLVIDDGWAAAPAWTQRMAVAESLLDQAEVEGRPVLLRTTAPPPKDRDPPPADLLSAERARAALGEMAPRPWPAERGALRESLRALRTNGSVHAVWLSDGLDDAHAAPLAEALQRLGRLTVITPETLPLVLVPERREGALVRARLLRPGGGPERSVSLRAFDETGRILGRAPVTLAEGANQAEVELPLPAAVAATLARLEVEEEAGAGTVALLDERWRRRPVGLAASERASEDVPLLSDLFYLERALEPVAEIETGTLTELMERPLSVMILADMSLPPGRDSERLERWVADGGLLVRFAGPNLARNAANDALLPVALHGGGRTMGGAMSWSAPQPLAASPPDGPLSGLDAPQDAKVNTQVLARPDPLLSERTWARLSDGTPLITATTLGEGRIILVHTAATPGWSQLPLSGLFPALLERLVAFGRGVADELSAQSLPPRELLDGFGVLAAPSPAINAVASAEIADIRPGPETPPGFYGGRSVRHAVNLSPDPDGLRPLGALPSGVERQGLAESARTATDLRPLLLAGAFLLLLADMLIALFLRGLVRARHAPALTAVLLAAALAPFWPGPAQADTDEDFALRAALNTRMAYVLTGDGNTDDVSRSGLTSLTAVLARRTAAELAVPMGIDVESDPLHFFPLIYWPVTDTQPILSDTARTRVRDYMARGGMILFDTRDHGTGGNAQAREHLRGLLTDLGVDALKQTPGDHLLTRTFYLNASFPGRYDGADVWIERDSQANDAVTPLVVGSHDWAGAWAADSLGRPLFATIPGGERQREMAYRFGVNLVIYALTGNYKADQVHLPAILERLTQ